MASLASTSTADFWRRNPSKSRPTPSLSASLRLSFFDPKAARSGRVFRCRHTKAISTDSENPAVDDKREGDGGNDVRTLLKRFWKVAASYWSSEDKAQARLRLAGIFALTLATTVISVGFNFLGRFLRSQFSKVTRKKQR